MGYTVEIEVPSEADLERAGRTTAIEVEASEYVLAVARREGVWLPADCQQGWCTTCAAELVDGEVDQSDAQRTYDVDDEANLILSCVAKPRSDLRIRTHRHDAMYEHREAHDLPPADSGW